MTGFLAMANMDDIARIDAAINELRVIVSTLLDPDVAERFREDWFPPVYSPEK